MNDETDAPLVLGDRPNFYDCTCRHFVRVGDMTPEERARRIVEQGGQILLPFDAGDAAVRFDSRWKLAEMIAQAIREAMTPRKD